MDVSSSGNAARCCAPTITPNAAIATTLERDIAMLLGRVLVALRLEILERADQLAPRLARPDHLVQKPVRGRDVGIRELLAELLDLLGARLYRIRGGLELPLVENVDRAFG